MADFSSIPVRINGQRFDASWWNSIRDALISSDTTPAFANYADDAAYEAAKGSAGVEGDYYYNTTVDFLKFHNGTDWVTVADAETAQTFTNKVIDGSVNTISNLTHGDQVDDPSSNVHGVTTDIVGVGDVQSLTNKTLDADLNTITNIEVDNFKTGVVDTDLTTVSASDDTLASAKAIKAYVDDTNTASDISYDNAASGIVATNVQDAIDEVDSDLDDHIIDTTTHGTTGNIVGTTDVQDVSNKAIIDPSRLDVKKDTFANLTTYASTATDGQLCFATDNLTAYVVHSSALNEVGGGGSGQGGINYITNYNAEEGLDDWSVVGTIPFSQETTSPLFGTASFKISSAGADYSGDYVSSNFTIDNAGKYNIISGEFWYRNTDLSSGDLQVRIYDVTNAAYISVSNNEIGASLAGDTAHKFTFQASDSINYRFEIYIASATLPAFNFIYDNVIVKPQEASVIGAPVTDWSTPEVTTIKGWVTDPTKGTMTKDEIKYQRVGQFAFIDMRIAQTTAGTAGSSFYLYNLPSGLTVDTSEIPTGTNGSKELALSSVIVSGTAGNFDGHVAILSDTQFGIVIKNTNSTLDYQRSTILPFSDATLNISVQFKVPIAGWSSGVVMSETTSNRHVIFEGSNSTGSPTITTTDSIPYLTTTDTLSAWDGDTFTTPEDGTYSISGSAHLSAATTTLYSAHVNGINTKSLSPFTYSSSICPYNGKITLKKGDLLTIQPSNTITLASSSTTRHWLTIERTDTGSQTIATSEKVFVHVTDATAQGFVAETVMNYATEIEDKHGAWDTNTFTAPRDGYYTITAKMMSSNYAWGTTGYGAGKLHILNASSVEQYIRNLSREEPGDTMQIQMGGTVTVYLDQGWKVQFSLTQNNTGTPVATSTDTEYNYITILAN